MESKLPNYIVKTRSWNAIGNMSFGGIYDVMSPTGFDTGEFLLLEP